MKKAKIAFWVILIAFVVSLAYQNWDFFMSAHGLRLNLLVKEYHTPELPNVILFLIFFFAGLLIAYFFSLLDRFKSKKAIKGLSATLDENEKVTAALKSEVDALKAGKPLDPPPPEETIVPEKDEGAAVAAEKVSDAS